MDLFKFEQAVKNGEITDFEHYFENGTFNEIRERKEICIKYGVAQEFYQNLKMKVFSKQF